MAIEAKDILFQEDLEAGFDEEDVLRNMDALAENAGDWKDHIPYTAARNYHEDPEILAQYTPHVDGCDYCQRLIDAVRPTDELIDGLQSMRLSIVSDKPVDIGTQAVGPMWQPMPIAAALLMGVLGTWFFTSTAQQPISALEADQVTLMNFMANPDQLQTLEASSDPLSKFRAARIYFAIDNPELAYRRIGEGFELANVEQRLVDAVAAASDLEDISPLTLTNFSKELSALADAELLSKSEQLRLIQLRANLGQHDAAIASLKLSLEEQGASMTVLRALEDAELVK